jgi:hypothetical protein
MEQRCFGAIPSASISLMALIEISKLNGQAGNRDFWQESRLAESAILQVASRLLQVKLNPTEGSGAHSHDFATDGGMAGDVKIWSGQHITLEISQCRSRDRIVPGWFASYQTVPNFGGLLAVNQAPSSLHGKLVFKLRWLPLDALIAFSNGNRHLIKGNSRGTYMKLSPMGVQHWWLGDFLSVESSLGPEHQAFCTNNFVANPRLNLQTLRQTFLAKFDTV